MAVSKSKYVRGIGCEKALWLDENKPEAADAADDLTHAEEGRRIGIMAQDLYGPHEVVPYNADKSAMIRDTEKLLAQNAPVICEASFGGDHVFCSVDLLVNHGNRHVDIVEVKSGSGLNPEYIDDAAFQKRVLEKNGYHVGKVSIAHVNTRYVRQGAIELHEFLTEEDITEQADQKQPGVDDKVRRLLAVQEMDHEPEAGFGADCPECAYWKYCSRDLPRPNVFDLPGQAGFNKNHKLKLYQEGCAGFYALKERSELKDRQKMTVLGHLEGKECLDREKIREFLKGLSFPLYFLDFESINPAIPPYDGTWPYRQIPFQYSLHWLESKNAELKHSEFLGDPETSPCRSLAEQLCRDIPKDACVTAYNMGFEKRVIRELAAQFPDLSDHLMNIHDHIADLMIPFQKLYWYLPAMEGSYSIKYVLPALYPDDPALDYHNLEDVHRGTEASAAFLAMAGMAPEDRARIRKNLLKYCGLDTFAMVKVWEALVRAAEGK